MLDKLKFTNQQLLNKYDEKTVEYRKQYLIKQILDNEECFFMMSIEQSYKLLKDLNIPEDSLRQTYMLLIDKKGNLYE